MAPFDRAIQNTGAVVDFLRNAAAGDLGRALGSLGAEAGRIAGSPELHRLAALVGDGTAVVKALQQGSFSLALQRLGGAPRDVEAVRKAEELVQALRDADLGAVAQLPGAGPVLQQAQSLTRQLGDGRALDAVARLDQALRQLAAATFAPDFAQALAARAARLLAQPAEG